MKRCYSTEYAEFRAYCLRLTDTQLLNVVEKEREGSERDPDREPHYDAARDQARIRGIL